MTTLEIEFPDQMAREIRSLVKKGWFASESELTRLAVAAFLRLQQLELQEEQQLADIAWAESLRATAS
jgi:Arc/MetJ-type ribon-helix-helix transcriptional regulator